MLRSRSIEAQFYAVKNSSGITTWCLLSTQRSFFGRGANDSTQSSASQNWMKTSNIRDKAELYNRYLDEYSSPDTGGVVM